MKTPFLILLNLFLIGAAFGQKQATTKLYFFSDPSAQLFTVSNPNEPILINQCTLVETNLDSLGLKIFKNRIVYIHLEPGQTYYFRRIISSHESMLATATLSACSEEDFWLNGYFAGMRTYRHYFLGKDSGLKLLAEEK
ncbi:hypothetical protein [Salmonirosea aquatica]|uniref:DUF4450 domain-containing protein n=1 Tax=Salmonirosea aquatica TaxID=2654236 RepID=A0A7C9F5X9_9BACT|nr:hypothetical protein [Cytophagaceae bacterium SJW1-29]